MINMLDILIREKLQTTSRQANLSAPTVSAFLDILRAEQQHLIAALQTQPLQTGTPESLTVFVHSQQYTLLTLLDTLYDERQQLTGQPSTADPQKLRLIDRSLVIVLEVWQFVQQFFAAMILPELPMPKIEWAAARQWLCDRLREIRLRLLSTGTVQLLSIAIQPIEQATDEAAAVPTYRKCEYLQMLAGQLADIPATADINCHLRTVLGNIGFNSPAFLQYMTEILSEELAAQESTDDKLQLLALRAKQIKQIQVRPGYRLYDNQPVASQYVIAFIAEEIDYLRTVSAMMQSVGAVAGSPEPAGEKIQTNWSLSVLAGYLKVQMEAGGYSNRVKEEVLRTAARVFTTKKNQPISYSSLRTLYNNIELSTGKAVIGVFAHLHQTARKIFHGLIPLSPLFLLA
ncbi:hypothetical protein EGT74_06480 [Chitinophaga lutea]|uniref:Uncharacterized protein n=1 Tax=Chitinophaga lutea TaxID=2488634 RepID=A0A3N4PWJ2_9BACT|nr:hypothetical protein [Chitinophaga lutea]RPE13173.1 hypothetical protein EGT74_06480 [Chitinophaga lutea]